MRLFARNRRDGARLLSSALVISVIGWVRSDHPLGFAIALVASLLSLYWWTQYRLLQH